MLIILDVSSESIASTDSEAHAGRMSLKVLICVKSSVVGVTVVELWIFALHLSNTTACVGISNDGPMLHFSLQRESPPRAATRRDVTRCDATLCEFFSLKRKLF
jgi:hypothetical protein